MSRAWESSAPKRRLRAWSRARPPVVANRAGERGNPAQGQTPRAVQVKLGISGIAPPSWSATSCPQARCLTSSPHGATPPFRPEAEAGAGRVVSGGPLPAGSSGRVSTLLLRLASLHTVKRSRSSAAAIWGWTTPLQRPWRGDPSDRLRCYRGAARRRRTTRSSGARSLLITVGPCDGHVLWVAGSTLRRVNKRVPADGRASRQAGCQELH